MPPETGSPAWATYVQKTTVRKLALKCKCGEVWRFSDGTGALPAGTRPMPTGDTFVCPKCGNSFDMKFEQQAEADALKYLNPPDKT